MHSSGLIPGCVASTAAPRQPSMHALVYTGPGAGYRSALTSMQSLRAALVDHVRVDRLTTEELLASGWQEGCLLLVMPGGADLPYCRHLNGRGNRLIREYVEGGGSYLGLCAGAYYASARVEFEPGTRLEVVGDRELAFFPGVARGSIYSGFEYESEAGAAAAPLNYLDLFGELREATDEGVCGQEGAGLAAAGAAGAAWVETQVQAGPLLAAVGAAADAAAVAMPQPSLAGCMTAAATGATAAGSGTGSATEVGTCSSGRGDMPSMKQQQQHGMVQQRPGSAGGAWRQCEDYINGGPGFFLPDSSSPAECPPPGVQVLANYPGRGGAAAAVLCQVGAGRAVLCGTHPELHPSTLEPCLLGGGDAKACSDRAARNGSNGGGGSSSSSSGGGGGGGIDGRAGQPLVREASGVAVLRGAQAWEGSKSAGGSAGIPCGSGAAPGACTTGTSRAAASAQAELNGTFLAGGAAGEEGLAAAANCQSIESKDLSLLHLREVHARLLAAQPDRWRYWRGLLVAAGLAGWLRPDGLH